MTIPLGMVKVVGKLPEKKNTYQVRTIGGTFFNINIVLMKKILEESRWNKARKEYKRIKKENKELQRNIRNIALGASKKLEGLKKLKRNSFK